ncbi:MAG: hypothetical protein ACREO0_07445, partial [Pseudoxanthomonas sp.]
MISQPSSPESPLLPAAIPAPRWQIALLWAGGALCALGLFQYRMWEHWHSGRFAELVLLSLFSWALAWPLRRFARWSWAAAMALPWGLALVFFAGALPVAATLVLAATALAIGGWLAARESPALQAVCGLALLGATLGWLLPLPVHMRWTYLGLALLLIALRRRALLDSLHALRTGLQESVASAPRAAAFAVLALGLASTGCWLPTMQVD